MKTRIILLVLMLSALGSYAQQDAQFTQYMYNTININPAYAGSRGTLSIFGLYRTQWVGLDGAPQTGTFSINSPIEGTNLGIGLGIINDRIGPSDETNIAVDVSYTVKTSEDFKLAFGLKASGNLLNIDFNKLSKFSSNDPKFQTNIDNRFSPNIGAGVYWYSDKTYIGVSVPNFLETKHFDRASTSNSTNFTAKERMNFYFIAGRVFDLSDEIKFKPALLSKLVAGAPLQVDVSGNFMFNEKFVLGAAYRWSAAVSLMAGFQVNPSWYIGYGYDLETTRLANYNSGSHEIFLRYELFKNYDRIISPRFF
jgi:type IX secretion system PorP/SprF family membrane protein